MEIEIRKKSILEGLNSKEKVETALRNRLKQLNVLFYLEGILFLVLIPATIIFGTGAFLGEPFLASKWQNAGLFALFSVTYSIKFPATLFAHQILRHYFSLDEGQEVEDHSLAKSLNHELKVLYDLKNWSLFTAFIALLILAFSKSILDLPDAIWEKTGLAFSLILLISAIGFIRRWNALRKNIDQFIALLKKS